jgi:hypothetical protein
VKGPAPGRAAVAFGLVALFAYDAVRQLDGLLHGMHRAGRPSFGAGDLAPLFGWPSGQARRVVDVWRDHAGSYEELASPPSTYETVFSIYAIVDSVFAIAFAFALLWLIERLDDSLRTSGDVAARGRMFVIVALAADIVENGTARVVVGGQYWLESLLWAAGIVKTLCYLLALVYTALLVSLWVAEARNDKKRRARFRTLRLLRIHILVVSIFALALVGHPQIPDLVRRWSVLQFVGTLPFVAAFAAMVWMVASNVARRPAHAWSTSVRTALLIAISLIAAIQLALFLVFRYLVDASADPGYGLVIPVALGVVVWLVGQALPKPPERALNEEDEEEHRGKRVVPAALAAAVPVALGLGMVHASFGDGVHTRELWTFDDFWRGWHDNLHPAFLVAVGVLVMPLAAWGIYRVAIALAPLVEKVGLLPIAIGVGIAQTAIAVPVWLEPRWMGETFGGLSLLAGALGGAALLASGLIFAANTIGMPRNFRSVGVSRVPVILLLILWLVIAGRFDSDGPHDVRFLATEAPLRGTNVDTAWACWLVKNGLGVPPGLACPAPSTAFAPVTAPMSQTAAVPLIFVASSGGATRAAYYTATVLDCVFETEGDGTENPCGGERADGDDLRRTRHLFALSGISGGAVGVATFALRLAEKSQTKTNDAWIDDRLKRDFLSPTIAWALFVEAPQTFLRYRHPKDRAEVLEESWESAWHHRGIDGDIGVVQLWNRRRDVPLLLLNGTSVEDGCRFNGSALDAGVETERAGPVECQSTGPFDERKVTKGEKVDPLTRDSVLPATRDLVDFLCGKPYDLRVSTVAIMSARFPYVSPSARLASRCDRKEDEAEKRTFVVDGGYLETSGASPIVEMWERLETLVVRHNLANRRCVVPYMIQIDNGYEDDAAAAATARPSELFAPAQTIVAARGARAAQAKAAAALAFNQPFESAGRRFRDRYAHFVIQTHAGPKAPLGWALSQSARRELADQLRQPKNEKALEEVRRWLTSKGLECAERANRRVD